MPTELRPFRPLRRSPAFLLGLAAVAAARLLTLPRSLWEWDEVLFSMGIKAFDPVHHRPHPPGYPLLIGLGKLFNLIAGEPFVSLVALSVVSCLVGYAALVVAFRRFASGPATDPAAAERTAVIGALLFHLSPTMLVYGPLALSDSPALMFVSLALAAAAQLPDGTWRAAVGLGAFASAAVGCRPQLAVAVLPMLGIALAFARGRRPRWAGLAAFTAVSLLWFLPLLFAVGGLVDLLVLLGRQADLVVRYDRDLPRQGMSVAGVLTRFLAHPWGPKWTALPLLALAAAGTVSLAARRRFQALPLAVFAGIDLAFGLMAMNPRDAVRYALPSLLAVAFAAGAGCEAAARRARRPAAAYGLAALLAAGFALYTAPLLVARSTTPSPPAQAAHWARRALPARAVLLVDKELVAHATYLLRRFERRAVEDGLERYASRPQRPVYLLADGESRWPGAVTFRWPSTDAYGKLTRDFYRVVSISPIPPARRYEAVRGVYQYEPTVREAGWRWLSDDAAIRLHPLGARSLAAAFRLHPEAPWPSNRVTIAVAGTPAARLEVPRGRQRQVVLPLPAAGVVEVRFRSEAAFVPAERGASVDRRRLALQLVHLEQIRR